MLENEMAENFSVVVLKVNTETYVVSVTDVKEIYVPKDKIIPIPLAEKSIIGIIDIRGTIYTIISLKQIIYRDGTIFNLTEKSRIILAELNGINIGILVDSVVGVRQLPINIFNLSNLIVETHIDYKFIQAFGVLKDETFILLDLNSIVQYFVGSTPIITEDIDFTKIETPVAPKPINGIPKTKVSESFPIKTKIPDIKKRIPKTSIKKETVIKKEIALNSSQQDVLREIGNIGSGNAITALSNLIKQKIEVDLTDVGIISFEKLAEQFGDPEENVCGIFSHIDTPSKSTILQIFEMKPLLNLVSSMLGKKFKIKPEKIKNKEDLSKEAISTITEIGNIMAGHYASALADLSGTKMMIDVPEFAMTSANSIGEFLSKEMESMSNYILSIKTTVNVVDLKLTGIFFYIPDSKTLEMFFNKLGISQLASIKAESVSVKPKEIDLNKITLTNTQKDALKEVGNIGAGNAANALAKMVNKRVDINIPSVEMVELDVYANRISKKKEKLIVAWSNVTGITRATVLTIFTIEDILKIAAIIIDDTHKADLSSKKINSINDIPEFQRSAISELGHILAGNYTSAIGDLLSIRLMTESPDMSVDNGKQLFNILHNEIGLLKKLSLVITTNVIITDIKIEGTFLFIPEIGTLNELLDALAKFYD